MKHHHSAPLKSLLCGFTLLSAAPAFAGAWVQDAGAGLLINQITYFSSSDYYTRGGDKNSQPTFNKLEYQPYAEYGLTSHITIGGSTYIQRDWQSGQSNTGIADSELFLRDQIYRDNVQVVSLQPLLKLPSLFTDNEGTPRGGSHSVDGELSLLYGRNFNLISPRDYGDFRLGYRARSHGLNDQIQADAAIGLSPGKNWQIIPAVRYIQANSLGNTTFSENGDQDYDLLKLETTVAYHLGERQWLQLSLFDHVTGKQTGSGQGVSIGYAMGF